jgi:hypothetical protein
MEKRGGKLQESRQIIGKPDAEPEIDLSHHDRAPTGGPRKPVALKAPEDIFGEADGIVELKLINDYVMKPRGLDKVDLELANKVYLNKNRTGMIMMYDPKCPHCKTLSDPYKQIAGMLQDSMFMGAINCMDLFHKNDLLANYLKIEHVPVLRLYNGSKFIDYTGGINMKDVLMWAAKNCKACRNIPQVAAYMDRIPAEPKDPEPMKGGRKKKSVSRAKPSKPRKRSRSRGRKTST